MTYEYLATYAWLQESVGLMEWTINLTYQGGGGPMKALFFDKLGNDITILFWESC